MREGDAGRSLPPITAATRLIALLGDPVSHSLSPTLQNAAFRAAGVDGIYLALRCTRAALPVLLESIARAGGGGNITVPHKQAALAAIECVTAAVERTGACNTFWLEDGRIHGDNTDVEGFTAALRSLVDPAGASVLLLGAGGGARAAACALLDAGVTAVAVLNRTPERAVELRERLDPVGRTIRTVDADAVRGSTFDIVVNATSLGLRDSDSQPFDLGQLERVGAVFDLVYRPGGTAWVRHASGAGIPAIDGKEMLLRQGVAAFQRWWQRPAPLEAMRAALDA